MERDANINQVKKKDEANIQPSLWKDLFYGKRRQFSCGTQRVILSGQDSSGSQSQRRIRLILPSHGNDFLICNVGVKDTVAAREVCTDLGRHQRHGSAYGQGRTVWKCKYEKLWYSRQWYVKRPVRTPDEFENEVFTLKKHFKMFSVHTKIKSPHFQILLSVWRALSESSVFVKIQNEHKRTSDLFSCSFCPKLFRVHVEFCWDARLIKSTMKRASVSSLPFSFSFGVSIETFKPFLFPRAQHPRISHKCKRKLM